MLSVYLALLVLLLPLVCLQGKKQNDSEILAKLANFSDSRMRPFKPLLVRSLISIPLLFSLQLYYIGYGTNSSPFLFQNHKHVIL